MSEDRLGQWLKSQGFLGGAKKEAPKPAAKTTPKTTTSRPAAKRTASKDATKEIKPLRKRPERNMTPRGKTNPKGRNTGPARKFVTPVSQNKKNDPFFDRPSHERRDKEHPTKVLPKGDHGDIRIVPLGGMEQVGENMMFVEWGDDIIVIDTGLVFGGQNSGVDAYIPDTDYLEKNKDKIRGVIYTHGHLDHIGGAPYILPKLGFPKVYATRLTRDMMLGQCEEFPGVKDKIQTYDITPKSVVKLGKFEIEFFHINHSIPDGVGICIRTPYGAIVNTSDFKIDFNPADEQPADLGRLAEIGRSGVAVAMVDSTNAQKPGQAISESVIKESLDKIIENAQERVIVATFSSNVGRVTKLIESAEKHGRQVFLTGRSMQKNIGFARSLNFLRCKDSTLQVMSRKVETMDPKKVMILCTGSQGEELAALSRMARDEHKDVKLRMDDTIVFSSSPIPGNERAIGKTLDLLAIKGIKPIDNKSLAVHVSGHGNAEELKLMTTLLNPRYCAPIHGEIHMRYAHKELLVNELGYPHENCFVMHNGLGLTVNKNGVRLMDAKDKLSKGEVAIQEKRYLSPKAIDQRRQMINSGAIIACLEHNKGTFKKVDYRLPGFVIQKTDGKFFTGLTSEIRAFWERNYDPSRPQSAIEKPLREMIGKYVYRNLRLQKDPVVEVIIR